MEAHGWITIITVAGAAALLVATRIAADLVMIGAVALLMTVGVLTPREALAGMANEATATVGVLFLVAAALRATGGMEIVTRSVLGCPKSVTGAQARLMLPVTALSALLNNTPIVAMMLPVVSDWAKKHGLSVSKLLLPLSYAAILGGTCTLIGTSTNLVVHGLLVERRPELAMGLFDLAWVGVPCAALGIAYVLLASRRLLPDRRPVMSTLQDPREYTVEMLVEPGSPLVGSTIEQAGLRHLRGMYLMEIHRGGDVLPAVSSEERLHAGDRAVFVGVVDSVVDLQRIRGLAPATDQVFKLDQPRSERCLVEAVVSDTCPLLGRTIREGRFRSAYNAAVIAVARNGERVRKKIGDIELRAGDTLLLEAPPSFVRQHRDSRDFFLVSAVEDSAPPRHDKAWTSIAILAAMVAAAGTGLLSMLNAALLAAGLLLATRCISAASARRSVDWQVLLVTAAAFGVSRALEKTGASAWVAGTLTGSCGSSPWAALAAVYAVTMVFNAFMSNNAAAALMFPIAFATAESLGVSTMPFAVAVMVAGSNDFATPIGYQTNLMVYGPGGYRFTDYLRLGGPLNLLVGAVAVGLIPLIWPFRP
ncbi:MAG: SLC13 family permease [Planctomycetes bacterium]|nr:SLC13 family permease [Planctomycetota bacterium]